MGKKQKNNVILPYAANLSQMLLIYTRDYLYKI